MTAHDRDQQQAGKRSAPRRRWAPALALLAALIWYLPAAPLHVASSRLAAQAGDSVAARVTRLLARMSVQQKVGQLVMGPVASVTATGRLGGVILSGPDVVSPDQGRALIAALQHAESNPLLVAADQEGGAISTMSDGGGVAPMFSPAQYGALGSTARVYQDALRTGHALRALGVTMDLAPVLDVLSDPRSPLGSRAYGSDPDKVAALGLAAIRGYQAAGIAATAKHFVGLGASPVDANVALPTDPHSLPQMERDELVPFRAAIAAGVDAVMVTHVVLPALDPSGTPASLSRPIITGFLRHRLGYQGVIITDSLDMGGLGPHIASVQAAALRAVEAGADMVLVDADVPTVKITLTVLDQAAFSGDISMAALNASVRRILTLKARLGLLGSPSSTHPSAGLSRRGRRLITAQPRDGEQEGTIALGHDVVAERGRDYVNIEPGLNVKDASMAEV